MKEHNAVFMAFAQGSESKEVVRKLYIGIAPVFVLAVNPSKEETEKLYNTELDEAPNYLSEAEVGPEGNKTKVPQARIDFVVKSDPEKCNGIEMLTRVTFFLSKAYRYNKDNTKVEVINRYGETTYLPIGAVKGTEPIPDNMKWYDTSDMRPAYIGEAELTDFIKKYLNIPNKSFTNPKTKEVKFIANLADAEARLDKIENYFKGDFTELKNIIKLQPNNRVKGMFGVRTTDDNKQYQAVYTQKFLKLNVTDYSKLDEEMQNRKAAGAYPTTEFSIEPLHEYNVAATDFNSPENDPLGVGSAPTSIPWDAWGGNK